MDLFILSGTRLEGDPEGASNRLYRNNRDGTFTDVTERTGVKANELRLRRGGGRLRQRRRRTSVSRNLGHNRLYRNNGDGTFTDVTKAAGL